MRIRFVFTFMLAAYCILSAGDRVESTDFTFALKEYQNSNSLCYFFIYTPKNGKYYKYSISSSDPQAEARMQGMAKAFLSMAMYAQSNGKAIDIEYENVNGDITSIEKRLISIHVNQ